MEQLIGKHIAKTDDGKVFEILEFQDMLDAGSHDNPNAKIPGLRHFELASGGVVNRKEGGVFEIVSTGQIVRSS